MPNRIPKHRRDVLLPAALAALVLVSRLPFIVAGYGNDADSWRTANSSRLMGTTGEYEASRFPGHPVQEIPYAFLWPGGPVALNLPTALFSVAAFVVMALILKHFGSPDFYLGALALAFNPLVYIYSSMAVDFVWALAFTLASLYWVLRRRFVWAGVALALAIGCRLTAAAMLLPFGLMMMHTEPPASRVRSFITLSLIAGGLGMLTYTPLFLKWGLSFLTFFDARHQGFDVAFSYFTYWTWGEIGVLTLMVCIPLAVVWRARNPSLTGPLSPWHVAAWLIIIPMHIALFIRNTDKAAYLMPAIPFVILLLSRYLERRVFQIACIALIVSSFLGLSRSGLIPGFALRNYADRYERMAIVNEALARMATLPPKSTVITGWLTAYITHFTQSETVGNAVIVNLPKPQELESIQAAGNTVYYLPFMDDYSLFIYDLDLDQHGVKPLLPERNVSD